MLYSPKLKNGKLVSLNWTIIAFRRLNMICWPLEDEVPKWAKVFDRCYYIYCILLFVQHIEAETRFLKYNFENLDLLLQGLTAYLVQNELALRSIQFGLRKHRYKQFLQKFYAEIYIEKSFSPKLFHSIQRKLLPTFICSSAYLLTLFLYVITPFISLYNHRRDLLYDMIYPFDVTPLYIYLPIAFTNIWLGFHLVTSIFGEANIISEVMLHLNGRYLLLNEDLQYCSRKLLREADAATLSYKFSKEVKRIIKRNVELNQFAAEIQAMFNYQIFIMFSFAALLLCVLGFKVFTNVSDSISFIVWIFSKTAEMIAIGEIGSTLIATTNNVSSMYYNSNWELIIAHSTKTRENIQLMKLLVIAIETNHKPFQLTGFNYFSVSLTTVMKIIQAAGSYFTCLVTIREK